MKKAFASVCLLFLLTIPFKSLADSSSGSVVYYTNDCEDYFVVYNPTTYDYSLLQWYGGADPSAGDTLYGDFQTYGFADFYDATQQQSSNLYVEEWGEDSDSIVNDVENECPDDADDVAGAQQAINGFDDTAPAAPIVPISNPTYSLPTSPPVDDTNPSNPSINIVTTSIPDGTLNQPYSADISVNYIGSYPTITFSGLPTGSTSSGFIQGGGIQAKETYANVSGAGGTVIAHLTGTPVVAGQYSVVMSVTEGTISQSQSFSLNVASPAIVVHQNTTTNTSAVSPIVASPTVIPTQTSVQTPAKQTAPLKTSTKTSVTTPTAAPTSTQMTTISFASTTQAVQQPVNAPKPSVVEKVFSAISNFFKHLF